jgi:hypothetical protein
MPQQSIPRAELFAGLEQCSLPVCSPASRFTSSRPGLGTRIRPSRSRVYAHVIRSAETATADIFAEAVKAAC